MLYGKLSIALKWLSGRRCGVVTLAERLKMIEKEVMLAKAEAETDERYKNTGLPIRLKLWLWDIESLRERVKRNE